MHSETKPSDYPNVFVIYRSPLFGSVMEGAPQQTTAAKETSWWRGGAGGVEGGRIPRIIWAGVCAVLLSLFQALNRCVLLEILTLYR